MQIALIADIHGNLIALEAVLAELAGMQIDRVICLGDIACGGPQSQQVVEHLQALGYSMVLGNADALCLDPGRIQSKEGPWGLLAEIDRWSIARLSPDAIAYIGTFQTTVAVELGTGVTLLCYHGSPRSYNETILATTPGIELECMLAGSESMLFAGGHTHIQLLRRSRNRLIINPGSVGMSFDPDPDLVLCPPQPWAEYAVMDFEQGRLSIDFRRVSFDAEAVIQVGLKSDMPRGGRRNGGRACSRAGLPTCPAVSIRQTHPPCCQRCRHTGPAVPAGRNVPLAPRMAGLSSGFTRPPLVLHGLV